MTCVSARSQACEYESPLVRALAGAGSSVYDQDMLRFLGLCLTLYVGVTFGTHLFGWVADDRLRRFVAQPFLVALCGGAYYLGATALTRRRGRGVIRESDR